MNACRAAAPQVEANRVFEITLTSEKTYADPFNDLELAAVFDAPGGKTLRVPAFWAGGQTWKVRYSSPAIGTHSYKTECSDAANAKLHGVNGQVEVIAYTGDNPLYKHGAIRVAAGHRHFEHTDGTPFFWLGDTWWMGLCNRLHWPEDFQTLTADRKQKGFNVVQIVAGLYPDMPAFDERGANEAGFPWEKDYSRIRPEYYEQADRRIDYLVSQGIVPCIVGAWGYHLPWIGTEKMTKHWQYLVARYGALPVVWCAAGETAMPYYLAKDKKKDAQLQKEEWTSVCRHIRKVDAFSRPLTLHPSCGVPTRSNVTDPSVADFELLQTGHGSHEVIAPTIRQIRAARNAQPPVPVINGEPAYENLLNKIPADVCRALFWVCMLNGAAGHTYGANGIWQVNRTEQPYGNSPGGNNWGTLPWPDAMKLPGSAQLALGKKLLTQFEWSRFEPQPNCVQWDDPATKDAALCASGLAGKVLIVYVPKPQAIAVKELGAEKDYDAALFDPISGERKPLGKVRTAADGTWRSPKPDGDHDWVLLLEAAR
ncbi:MAG TPA: DUF4038 domain-containing protein [Planctomycetota bacterium]